jgi:transposase InsO family protein
MGSKIAFVEQAKRPGANISALCREHGISRQTGHKWLKRFREGGFEGLQELSRRPSSSPSMTSEAVVAAVLALRARHPSWGPEKLARVLRRDLLDDAPSRATIARLLKAAGKVRTRRPRVRVWRVDERPHVEVQAPNDLWTMDFKGWWKAKNGQRCEPLTVRDAMSRMMLAVTLVASTSTATVRKVLEKLFRTYGVPKAILVDNGSPWINTRARGGLTKLSAWLVSLGIRLHRSRLGSPQDNGGHERMHRDLDELSLNPATSRRAQQHDCDRWRIEFNHVRPHDALGGKTPAEVYGTPSPGPITVRVPVYPSDHITRRVLGDGSITVQNDRVSIGRPLVGYRIGLRPEGGLRWRAHFFDCDLGIVEIAGHDVIAEQLDRVGELADDATDDEAGDAGDTTVTLTVNQPAA